MATRLHAKTPTCPHAWVTGKSILSQDIASCRKNLLTPYARCRQCPHSFDLH